MKSLRMALPMAALLAVAAPAWSAPDDLDPAFGSGGRLQLQDGFELGPVTRLIALSNDEVLALDGYSVWRVDRDGVLRDAVSLDAVCKTIALGRLCWVAGTARQPDGKLIVGVAVQSLAAGAQPVAVGLARLLPDGRLDGEFGSGGIASPVSTPRHFTIAGIAIQPDGGIVVAGLAEDPRLPEPSLALVRFVASGVADHGFGNAGFMQLPIAASTLLFLQTTDHKLVLAGRQSEETIVVRLLTSGQFDAGFGANGVYRDARSGALVVNALTEQSDGKLVVVGSVVERGIEQLAVSRIDRQGRLDNTFGTGGTVLLSVDENHDGVANAVAIDGKGRIVLAGRVTPVRSRGLLNHRIAVARFHPDGAPDTFFAGGGITTIWNSGGAGYAVMITSSNQILVGGDVVSTGGWQQPALIRLKGGESSVMRVVREAIAVEYVHALFGNYFVTSSTNEIRLLDLMPAVWVRTGSTFRVWTGDSPGLHPVCRFFSGHSFAPRFSHFLTPYLDECAALRAQPTWTFEGEVFRLRLPEGEPGVRDCLGGTARLYRLYNNGMDGAPYHRYTTDPAVLDLMIASGWAMEGDAQTRVFACIPPA